VEVRVAASADDAEEQVSDGKMDLKSSDLEMVLESQLQTVGIRFRGVAVPRNATIVAAWVQFQVDEKSTATTALRVEGEAADNASGFTTSTHDISGRPRTAAFQAWSPVQWPAVGVAGPDQQVDVETVIQEIVRRDGWASGNALALIVTGTGKRVARSFDGQAGAAPLLHVEYRP
jgi:hypothetical protein